MLVYLDDVLCTHLTRAATNEAYVYQRMSAVDQVAISNQHVAIDSLNLQIPTV